MNILLLNLLEQVLGKSTKRSGYNYEFKCVNPDCPSHSKRKKKLEINLETRSGKNSFHCWSCDYKGSSLHSLFKKIKVDKSKLDELTLYVGLPVKKEDKKPVEKLKLPSEYIFLGDLSKVDLTDEQCEIVLAMLEYLESREITKLDIYRYHIGACLEGTFKNRIILPSYNKFGQVNNFVARLYQDSKYEPSYLKPNGLDENVINFENLIDFNRPIILCEGVFDAITIGDNAIPLFGKNVSTKLLDELYNGNCKDVYICLDKDALSKTYSYAKQLMKVGKNVYIVEMEDKDASSLGKKLTRELIKNTKKTDLNTLLKIKRKIVCNN